MSPLSSIFGRAQDRDGAAARAGAPGSSAGPGRAGAHATAHDAPSAHGGTTAGPHAPLLVPELMARVRQIEIRTHRLVNTALSGGYRSTFRGSGLEFSEVRAYQPGDEVRRIDWNVTARTGDAYIKTYAEERELTLHLLVDTSRSMDFGSHGWTKRETAAQFAALISFVAIRHQDRVGLLLFGAEPGLHLPAKKGGQHVLRIVREVIAAPAQARATDLASALEHAQRVLRRRSIVFVVSDFLGDRGAPAGMKSWTDRLAELAQRHDVIAVRAFDPLEEELPSAGILSMEELETGRRLELDTRDARVRAAWAERAKARRAELVAGLARARADLLELDATRDLGETLLAFFRRRMLRHGGAR
ncbi:MAG: DUF58 domain-containing protein [Planctomycetes bacterium]|nr:DUF58 domain-containing protein [Planctomycetota bacterium]